MIYHIHDKAFGMYIPEDEIIKRVKQIADQISADYQGRNPVFIGVLNGCFMFIAELFKHVQLDCTLNFVKLNSYEGLNSTGKVLETLGLQEDVSERDIIIVEDIVDTGNTMSAFIQTLKKKNPNSIKICTLLSKPEVHLNSIKLDYIGFEIPNKFVVGYGLDVDGLGRNLPCLYQIFNED